MATVYNLMYFTGVLGFIVGLQRLGHPATAKKGNLFAAGGMALAILASLATPLEGSHGNYLWIFAGLILGTIIGYRAATKVQMTEMPQLVSLFNGLGGACAVLISLIEVLMKGNEGIPVLGLISLLLTLFIGSVAFSGSLVAWAKLDGRLKDKALVPPFPHIFNLIVLLACVGMIIFLSFDQSLLFPLLMGLMLISLVYGITFVAPIGGADMPVVISLLNSFTGLTAALAGLIYDNQLMLMGGILVGSSGIILTVLMCKAMNRSLGNVLMGAFGSSSSSATPAGEDNRQAKELSKPDASILLTYSSSVMVVPGYGLAVAQAQ
ncbi:MAG: NAD(P)(+) transhydrogenase (Re/Si-specific) subunit beta, partial [Bacteroidota bacterium]